MVEYDRSVHKNPNAQAWAEFFCDTFPDTIDEGTMIGWFSNAIHDHLLNVGPLCGDELEYMIDNKML